MKRRTAILVNPKAGPARNGQDLRQQLQASLPPDIDHEFLDWDLRQDHAAFRELLTRKKFDTVAAVGGDGTVNLVGKQLMNTDFTVAIIPSGSGNGLARHLNIPLNIDDAMALLQTGTTQTIDAGTVNDIPFFCTAGIGFDARVSHSFASSNKRGFASYVKVAMRQLITYRSGKYNLVVDGYPMNRRAFLITVANASQYGNNAFIAPAARITDGLLNICVLKPFPIYAAPAIARRLFSGKLRYTTYYESWTAKDIMIKKPGENAIHFDGETTTAQNEIRFHILPHALKVLVSS